MRRVLYVDGFNFYYGVTCHWRKEGLAGLGWCNFSALVKRHFPCDGELLVKYFTAPVYAHLELPHHRPGETKRYATWMRALRVIENLVVIEGFHKPPDEKEGREEKQTDVNLAVEMLVDAFRPIGPRPQHVFVLSGDCDLMPAIFALQERLSPAVRVTVLLPSDATKQKWEEHYRRTRSVLYKCHSATIQSNAPLHPPPSVVRLSEEMLADSLLGYFHVDSEGEFECPKYWRLPTEYLNEHCHKPEWRPDRKSYRRASDGR